jgi:AcrR family transcriptional regulator
MSNLREQLVDAAERLFAQNGIAGTTVRDITGGAGANVASVNYYFGSREALLQAVIARRQEPLNEERLRLLAEAAPAGEPPQLRAVLHALAAPCVRLAFEHPSFARLASRLRAEADGALWREYRASQSAVRERFQEALAAALPDLPDAELETRFHYVLGALQQLWAHCPFPPEETPDRVLTRFLRFFEAGLQASASDECERGS